MTIVVTVAFGLEAVVARELKKLGFEHFRTENGRILLEGGFEEICQLNFNVSAGERVMIRVAEFQAETFDALFEQTRSTHWEDYIPLDANIPVDAKSVESALFSLSDCQRIVKKAIVERLRAAYGCQLIPETGARYPVLVSIHKNHAELLIDTSGDGLHKRGWRNKAGEAPIKETLANAMAALSFWRPERPLVDPFCGSGTILIEAVLREMHVAPGISRDFVCKYWPQVSKDMWQEAEEACRRQSRIDQVRPMLDVCGYDRDGYVLQAARSNAKNAGVDGVIHFQQRDFSEFSTKKQYGCMITNPPYGERMGDRHALEEIYRNFRRVMRENPTWSFYVLTADEAFENRIERKADKKRKLFNGRIRVDYYQFYGPRPPKKDEIAL